MNKNEKPGEIIISEEAFEATGLEGENMEKRQLSLKGRNNPVNIRVIGLNCFPSRWVNYNLKDRLSPGPAHM